jgi:hypothetical protein
MPRRRRRIIKGLGHKVGAKAVSKRISPAPNSQAAAYLAQGWKPGDRWGPGENDVIPGGPPRHGRPGTNVKRKPPKGKVTTPEREGKGGRAVGRRTKPPVPANPPDADGGFRGRTGTRASTGSRTSFGAGRVSAGTTSRTQPSATSYGKPGVEVTVKSTAPTLRRRR